MVDDNDQSRFTITQDMDIAQPEKASAIPITVKEWTLLRQSVAAIGDSASFFHTIGSSLIGAGISTGIAAFFTNTPEAASNHEQLTVMWAIAAVCLICGVFAIFFAYKEKEVITKSSRQVLSQMDVIQDRYALDPD